MKVLLFANTGWYLYNFRRALIEALRHEGYDVLLASPRDQYCEKLRELGFRWIEAPMRRQSLNPIRELALVNWLKNLMIEEEVQLVHSFTLKCAIYGSLAARIAKVPARINAVAGLGYTFTRNDIRARTLRLIVKALMRAALGGRGLKLVLQNPDDEALLKKLNATPPENICIIPGSGVNCEKFTPTFIGTREGAMKVLLPARMLWDKGVREFIEASKDIKSRGGGVDFILAGSPDPGNPTSVPQSELENWEAAGLAEWLGHVDDMPGLLARVDVVALPSYREGLPKGLIEAGACGKPLITTDVPGCNQVVKDCVNGLLVPPRDATALSQAILKLRDNPELRAKFGQAARSMVVAYFDERIVVQRTCEIYTELLSYGKRQANEQKLRHTV